jgi:glycosyltransferase involved in cell wall biosynthesis
VTVAASTSSATSGITAKPHISVCVCTYKRPDLLRALLLALAAQDAGEQFTYSVIVADNDRLQSARSIVLDAAAGAPSALHYCVEPRQNIALARNAAIEHASGELVAFIDDDEVPPPDWLLRLLTTCRSYDADGVLGPVVPRFAVQPPEWVRRGRLFDRPCPPTGTWLHWQQTRTGNVLLRRRIFDDDDNRFRPECGGGGEDVDFFRRMMAKGLRFVWSADAAVEEVVPPERCTRSYLLTRALLRGRAPHNQGWPVVVSLVAVPSYAIALPVLLACGQHVFMRYLIKECDHLGRLLALVARKRMDRLALTVRA